MTRLRDNQRSKVYAAERVAFIAPRSKTQGFFSLYSNDDGRTTTDDFGGLEGAQTYVNEVLANPKVRDTFGRGPCRKVEVYYTGLGGSADTSTDRIRLGTHVRTKPVALHELAHMITGRYYGRKHVEAHGAQFAAVYLFLVRVMLGDRPADDLRASYELHGVKFLKTFEPALTEA